MWVCVWEREGGIVGVIDSKLHTMPTSGSFMCGR